MSVKDLEVLGNIIQATDMLSPRQKSYLSQSLNELKPLEILKLKHSLVNKFQGELADNFQTIQARVGVKKIPISLDSLKKIKGQSNEEAQRLGLPKNKKLEKTQTQNTVPDSIGNNISESSVVNEQSPVAFSVLTDSNYLSQIKPVALNEPADKLHSLSSLTSLSQLNQLSPSHIDFLLDENVDQILLEFFAKLEKMFANFKDIRRKRSYLMTFLQSSLFASYMNTGLTAFRHPEITPASTRLNTLHKTNEQYLGKKQFQYAALISHHIRNLAVV